MYVTERKFHLKGLWGLRSRDSQSQHMLVANADSSVCPLELQGAPAQERHSLTAPPKP